MYRSGKRAGDCGGGNKKVFRQSRIQACVSVASNKDLKHHWKQKEIWEFKNLLYFCTGSVAKNLKIKREQNLNSDKNLNSHTPVTINSVVLRFISQCETSWFSGNLSRLPRGQPEFYSQQWRKRLFLCLYIFLIFYLGFIFLYILFYYFHLILCYFLFFSIDLQVIISLLFVCLFIYLFIYFYLFIYLFLFFFIYLSIFIFILFFLFIFIN